MVVLQKGHTGLDWETLSKTEHTKLQMIKAMDELDTWQMPEPLQSYLQMLNLTITLS